MENHSKNLIAQWAFDCRPVLGRFHIWLEDVEERWIRGEGHHLGSFVGEGLERCFIMAAGVTALGTKLFGRYGEGKGLGKADINRVKKDADAVSAYAMSEALWYLTRNLPENHAVMVSLGEGLMPKAGETPEMGSNPLLGFGRVYARPQVARFLDERVHRLLNDPAYGWDGFWHEVQSEHLTIWGAAIDTLENTSRFAKGAETGPMSVLHLFDQPLEVSCPYEGYMGTLVLPVQVVEDAADRSTLVHYRTPRAIVLDAIRRSFPDIPPERVHVWTLGGPSRKKRLEGLWNQWRELGVDLLDDDWPFPDGNRSFSESGTYAPTYRIGPYVDGDGRRHLFLLDGYAASAEAIQAASLDPVLGLRTSMCMFSSRFEVPVDREWEVMRLDPKSDGFAVALAGTLEREPTADDVLEYREIIRNAREAGMPLDKSTLIIDDFFPTKRWRVLSLAGMMLPDPYTGAPGVEEVSPGLYRVTTRAATRDGILEVTHTLRMMETMEECWRVFSPLLDRFYSGVDFRNRAVKVSDSGRIRNELQTLISEALEHLGDGRIRVCFDRVDDAVLPPDKRTLIRDVLEWYKANHPIWFTWLDLT